MLNKEVCKRCKLSKKTSIIFRKWTSAEEDLWSRGRVFCPAGLEKHGFSSYGINIGFDPPSGCRYALEHIVSSSDDLKGPTVIGSTGYSSRQGPTGLTGYSSGQSPTGLTGYQGKDNTPTGCLRVLGKDRVLKESVKWWSRIF